MTRTTKLMALCAFAFGLSLASTAIAACNSSCFQSCKTAAINRCIANGGVECDTDVTYYHFYRQCVCIIP